MTALILLVFLVPVALYLVGSIFIKLFGFLGMNLPRTRAMVNLTKPLIDSQVEIVRAVLRWLIRILQFLLGLLERNTNEGDRLYCLGFFTFAGAL